MVRDGVPFHLLSQDHLEVHKCPWCQGLLGGCCQLLATSLLLLQETHLSIHLCLKRCAPYPHTDESQGACNYLSVPESSGESGLSGEQDMHGFEPNFVWQK